MTTSLTRRAIYARKINDAGQVCRYVEDTTNAANVAFLLTPEAVGP